MRRGPSIEQKDAIASFMAKNLQFARNQYLGEDGARNKKKLWTDLTTSLNSIGGTVKTTEQWMKFWNDWRGSLRAKIRDIRKKSGGTGGSGPSFEDTDFNFDGSLTATEKKLLSIMSLDSIDGDKSTPEFGLGIDKEPHSTNRLSYETSELKMKNKIELVESGQATENQESLKRKKASDLKKIVNKKQKTSETIGNNIVSIEEKNWKLWKKC